MRVLIADDHSLFRESLQSLLESRDVDVVGQARSGKEAVELARELEPDVVLMDLMMAEMDGMEATRRLTAELPGVKVVVLTAREDDAALFEAVKAGAVGYVRKDVESEPFFSLLEAAARGEAALTPPMARKLLQEFAKPRKDDDPDALTRREEEVLQLMVSGVTTNQKLAKALGVSENTIKFHVRNILDKLHLHNRAQAVAHALRHRLVRPQDPDPV